ncbi:hypothetical protein [Nocardiopsis suaedae]|uniref:Uncharacterized protein n=1 Tax=Nocardiopsis suaedae TaxID=3018444 RepID=A0ABT4TRH6_9ACTN|nr:hypothetical protein [Nocardiopsis suaedae]MDA2807309.1 hypothetical protein [Nocardiopsis suaedae]
MERLGLRIRGRLRAVGARGAAWAHRRAEAEERHRYEVMRGRLDAALHRLGSLLERGRPWTPGDLHAHGDLVEEHREWSWQARSATRSEELVDVYQRVLAAQRKAAKWV